MSDNQQPEKMTGESLDISEQRRKELKQLFPGVFTETIGEDGQPVETIDFERLKFELGTFSDVYVGRRERYGMEWPGKRDCMKLIQEPSRATLKPCRKESVDFNTTQNLFIEGDNLEVLKLLQKAYYGKVKTIYIDPPYNTGKEFIYPDKYAESLETYLAYAGLIDDEGKKFSTNTIAEGRFHTKWLNMMYPRIYLAKNLLREDGVIFISIDDNEVENLRRMCDEIFGEENFVAQMVWEGAFKNDARQIGVNHEYVLVYARARECQQSKWSLKKEGVDPVLKEVARLKKEYGPDFESASRDLAGWFRANKATLSFAHRRFRNIDKIGAYKEDDPTAPGGRRFDLINPKTGRIIPLRKNRGWGFDQDRFNRMVEEGRITFVTDDSIMVRRYLHETDEMTPQSVFYQPARSASERLTRLMGAAVFDFPKDELILRQFIEMSCDTADGEEIVLDFFAGSGTTGHATMLQNLSDSGNRRYILVQLPEPIDSENKGQKIAAEFCDYLGMPKNIAELGKERLRRVGAAVKENRGDELELEETTTLDFGFKVLKLDKSNFSTWNLVSSDIDVGELSSQLDIHVDHIDPTASKQSILYELLLKAGFMPTEKIEILTLADKQVFSIAEGALLICLEEELPSELIDAVADREPMQFICLDKGFKGNDQLKANAVQTFKSRSRGAETEMVFKVV